MAGWWRRNRWGLVALGPVLAATVALQWGDVRDRYFRSEPREPVNAAADGWVTYAGARMRLTDLGPATDLADFAGKQYRPPGGTEVWRATLRFNTPRPDDIAGCDIALEDGARRVYAANPQELTSTRAGFASCIPSDKDEGKPEFERVAHFIVPDGARPAAVRITLTSQIPRYARLTR